MLLAISAACAIDRINLNSASVEVHLIDFTGIVTAANFVEYLKSND